MNLTPKNRILLIIIGILLISNIALITTLVLKPGAKKGMRGDRFSMITTFLQNEIDFSKYQMQQYNSLNTEHRLKMKALFDQLKKDKEVQLKVLSAQQFNDSAIIKTAVLFSNKQIDIETAMLHHFKDIRAICTPQQLPKFDSLFYKIPGRRNENIKK